MRGSKYGEEIKEKAFAMLASGQSSMQVARELGLPSSTVRDWRRAFESGKMDELPAANEGALRTNDVAALPQMESPAANDVAAELQRAGSADDSSVTSFAELRRRKKEEFIENTWRGIGKAGALLEKRLDRALKLEEEIARLISIKNPTDEESKQLANALTAVKGEGTKEIAVILGTLYDKQALASGDPTENHGGEITVKKWEEL